MSPRAVCLFCLLCLGCHTPLNAPGGPRAAAARGEQAWLEGQQALRQGDAAAAVAHFERSLQQDPELARNHFSLAAALAAQGDDVQACLQLGKFLAAQPEHRSARLLHAELLHRNGHHDQARDQFECLINAALDTAPIDTRLLVHCHGRLLSLAEAAGAPAESELQRGLGLYWLAEARAELGAADAELPVEALLCKAAACLSAAHALRPEAVRPCWYLHRVWRKLGQPQQAQRWLEAVRAGTPWLDVDLSAAEQRSYLIACQLDDQPQPR